MGGGRCVCVGLDVRCHFEQHLPYLDQIAPERQFFKTPSLCETHHTRNSLFSKTYEFIRKQVAPKTFEFIRKQVLPGKHVCVRAC